MDGVKYDEYQYKVVVSESKNILVVAGAGCGKSTTIVSKINYLINNKDILPSQILCVSFTNESCNSLKEKLSINNYDVEVLTFHKLSLKILENNKMKYKICSEDYLWYLINEYFYGLIYGEEVYIKIVIKYYHKICFGDINKIYSKIDKSDLISLIYRFICLFRTNGYDIEYLIKLINNSFGRRLYFLYLVVRIIYEYKISLDSEEMIDFDDMILIASKSKISFMYKYVIVDEFQDTSYIRFNLINNIVKSCDSNLIVVGDDYQSIYGFSGCDLSLFLGLNNSDFEVIRIINSYRSSQELINVACKFVNKDKLLINKELKSCKSNSKPIKIVYYKNIKRDFKKLMEYLVINNINNIMILGRNNNSICEVTSDEVIFHDNKIHYKNKDMIYYTVHKSKGLESDNVVIISLYDGEFGFPCKIKNNNVLNLVMRDMQKNSYSEERRLFYVALTRSKNNVYLYTSLYNPSIFVNEIIVNSYKYVEFINI